MGKQTECPICKGEYTKIHLSHKVCNRCLNAGWIVTTCPDCSVSRFSQTKGVCSSCLDRSPLIVGFGFSKNRRSRLARSGMG